MADAAFFLFAGVSTWFSLRSRTAKYYLEERVKRLLVPLVSGCLILVPGTLLERAEPWEFPRFLAGLSTTALSPRLAGHQDHPGVPPWYG